uniref:Musculin n=1 Tax=Fundulus heteroclitus TaxID=8078 RepID=A0A3Q2PS54_FUNHE
MSTGSAPSDPEDDEIFCGRTSANVRKATRLNSGRFSDTHLDEEDAERRQIQQERSGLPKAQQKESRQSQRNAANARERARMRVLSKAFSRLKTSLPWVPADTKLSKLDTLRLASSYICHLRQILQEDRLENSFAHPVSLVRNFSKSHVW